MMTSIERGWFLLWAMNKMMTEGQLSQKLLDFAQIIINSKNSRLYMGLESPTIAFLETSFYSPLLFKLKWLGFIKQAHDSLQQDNLFLSDFDICYVKLSSECYRPDYVIDLIKPLRSTPVSSGVNYGYAGYLKAAAQCFMQ
jgi:hypothetical protein